HDPGDRDAVVGEELGGGEQERGAGRALLVGQDLRERDAGVVIDRDMDVVEPDPTSAAAVVVDHLRAVDAPAAAVGDPAEFLDIDMEQIAGVRVRACQMVCVRGGSPYERKHTVGDRQGDASGASGGSGGGRAASGRVGGDG